MDLACRVDDRGGTTLVELDVTNSTRTTRRIRIDNALAGKVLPPQHHGTPVEGWDEEGVTVTVDAGEHRALGYACQAPPESPPARIVGSEPTDGTNRSPRNSGTVLAALGDPRPPRDVVDPDLRGAGSEVEESSEIEDLVVDREVESGLRERRPWAPGPDQTDSEPEPPDGNEGDEIRTVRTDRGVTHGMEPPAIPPAIDAWLRRKADDLAAGESVDPAVLRAVSRRAEEIATRAQP